MEFLLCEILTSKFNKQFFNNHLIINKMSAKKSNQKKSANAATVQQPENEQPITEQTVTENPVNEQTPQSQEAQMSQMSQILDIKIADIVPNPANPRRYFDEESLSELAKNITQHGVLQPVTVREIFGENNSSYELIFGERRFRAAKIAGLEAIPCMVRQLCDDAAFDLMISENLQRQDIRPSEEGVAFKRLMDKGKDIRYISERYGKSETFIHNRLSLVRLIHEITDLLDREEITIGMAFEISRFDDTIQGHIHKEHLTSEIPHNNWKNISLKAFKGKLEDTYTVLLSRFPFDKSECEQCPRNSEFYSLFPVSENSRCTNSECLRKKQENYELESILSAIGDENLEVYVKTGTDLKAEIVKRLGELGIEVKTGQVYPMPEEPVMPVEEAFTGNKTAFAQAKADFNAKLTKWNSFQDLLNNGVAQKVIVIENLAAMYGYIVVPQVQVQVQKPENQENIVPVDDDDDDEERPMSDFDDNDEENDTFSETPDIAPVYQPVVSENAQPEIKPDLLTVLQEKDRQNAEEALLKVIADAKKLLNDTVIPPVEFTPFEEALMNYVMLPCLKPKHYEFFGIPEGQSITENIRFDLHNALSDEQKTVLKREFLLYWMVQTLRIEKKSALLIELVKSYFPDEIAEIESIRNEEYMKQHEVIQAQIDKLMERNEELVEAA